MLTKNKILVVPAHRLQVFSSVDLLQRSYHLVFIWSKTKNLSAAG